jgi:hypothetical protein
MYAKGLDEEETAEWLDEVLVSDADSKKKQHAKAGAAA